MKYVLVLTVFTLLACRSLTYPPEEVQSSIVGTWSMVSDSEPHVFRMVKADSFTTFVRGFQFHEDGKLVIYGPWGCQMPPSFREYSGTWRVDKKGNVVVSAFAFSHVQAHWKILSLSSNELRYITDLVL